MMANAVAQAGIVGNAAMDDCDDIPEAPATVGFLSVLDVAGLGFCGGYLLLNRWGRPLEFHCTLPVQPDRAQQILFGTTLQPFLFCQHIGRPLVSKTRTIPGAIFVPHPALLGMDELVPTPVIRIWRDAADSRQAAPDGGSAPATGPLTDSPLQFQTASGQVRSLAWQLVASLQPEMDLLEPFDRIHEAIQEAHSARAA